MKTFADKVIAFNQSLVFKGILPKGIRIMNPFQERADVLAISSAFYKKYYSDNNMRYLILGINPGRFGSAMTGIPFTDPKRLQERCHIPYSGPITHEPSSVFVYDVIEAFGGEVNFYNKFYIHSICPLGFTISDEKGRETNYNYYDSQELTEAVKDFIIWNIRQQIALGVHTDVCFCFGTGKNEKFLRSINDEYHFFKEIIALEHPRYIIQYKMKSKQDYIEKFVKAFNFIK